MKIKRVRKLKGKRPRKSWKQTAKYWKRMAIISRQELYGLINEVVDAGLETQPIMEGDTFLGYRWINTRVEELERLLQECHDQRARDIRDAVQENDLAWERVIHEESGHTQAPPPAFDEEEG